MVHGFRQQSLGRLEIESELGRGTRVRMLLPAATERVQPIPSRAVATRTASADPRTNSETILVVEDSEDVLALAQEYLITLGYRVLLARNADDALMVLEEHGNRIDLLFPI
jgi:PleD family two-component response regulator